MPIAPHTILGPRHIHPGVRTEADYRRTQIMYIARARAKFPNLIWRDPWVADVRPAVYITAGMWQICCATPGCGNCPSVSSDWRLACCWDCGAVYEGLDMPADAERAVEVLLCRPVVASRNWTGESVDDLVNENRAHGDPVPAWAEEALA